jgi:HEAT repeat protein
MALGKLGGPEAIPPLVRLLDARDAGVRSTAARALGAVEDRSAAGPLLEVAERDENVVVRSWAISALSRIGDPAVTPSLVVLLVDESPSVRRGAATALAELGDARGVKAVDAIWKRERFTPRFLRGARPGAPVGPVTAITLTLAWATATAD